jgi:HAD superfamily hydrolase (TIGR01484 family)
VKPLAEMPGPMRKDLRGVFTDIDDTITTHGSLPSSSYVAIERLSQAGLAVVAITGRPAGWCDMIARFWPVAGVVGENGAFYFRYDHDAKRMRRRFFQSEDEREAGRQRLQKIARRVLAEIPGAAIASDQAYRESDLAVDFAEDVPILSVDTVARIVAIYEEEGATAKMSSIHVNGWFGTYDKLTMTRLFVEEVFGLELDSHKAEFVYCGDSPNDAPMFRYFPNSCGVANIKDFEDRIEALPAYIANSHGADGFAEIVEVILSVRNIQKS